MELERTGSVALFGWELVFVLELEADQTRRELDGARAAEAGYAGGEERLSGGEDGIRCVAIVAETVGVEAKIFCSDDIEDVHEEIKMMTFAFEGEVFDQAEVERGEGRLAHGVASGECSADGGAIVQVVGVVLRVEADDGRVWHAGARDEERIGFEPDGKIEDGVEIEDLTGVGE
jgi:hypothetical protein